MKNPWGREWQPTPVFLLGEFHGQRNLVGYSLMGHNGHDWATNTHTHTHNQPQFSSVQLLSHVWLPDSMDCSMSGFPIHHHLLKLAQTHVHWVGNATQPSHSLSSLLLQPSVFPRIRDFSNESVLCIRWPKYWHFSFSQSFQWIFRTDHL